MPEYIATWLTTRLLRNKLIAENEKHIYQYSLQVKIEKIVGMIAIIILGYLLHVFFQTIIFWLFFSSIRKRSGGYHMNSFFGCFLGSIGLYMIFAVGIYPFILDHLLVNYFFVILSYITIMLIGSVNHPNMAWTDEEYRASKKRVYIIATVELICIIFTSVVLDDNSYMIFMSYGIILTALLLIIAKLIKQEVKV